MPVSRVVIFGEQRMHKQVFTRRSVLGVLLQTSQHQISDWWREVIWDRGRVHRRRNLKTQTIMKINKFKKKIVCKFVMSTPFSRSKKWNWFVYRYWFQSYITRLYNSYCKVIIYAQLYWVREGKDISSHLNILPWKKNITTKYWYEIFTIA